MKNIDLLILDGNFVCTAAKHSCKGQAQEYPENFIVYAVLRKILPIVEQFNPSLIAWAWDSRYSFRREVFPEYKCKRARIKEEKTEDEKLFDELFYSQLNEIRDCFLPFIGFTNNFIQNGIEGDDIIAKIVQQKQDLKTVFVSNDNDMFQIVTENVKMFDHINKVLYGPIELQRKFGIHPSKWLEVKKLIGCSGDDIPGIQGVQIKTAIKFLTGNLNTKCKAYTAITCEDGLKRKKENEVLVKIPHQRTNHIKIDIHQKIRLRLFADMLHLYNLRSLLKTENLERFQKAFRME